MVKAVSDAGYNVSVEKTTFGVGGAACASRVSHVEKALLEAKGIISAFVNLATEKATVEYLPGETYTADFRKAVENAGFQLSPNTRAGVNRQVKMY